MDMYIYIYKYQWIFIHIVKIRVQISLLFYTKGTPYIYNFTLGHAYLCQMHLLAYVFCTTCCREKVEIL